VAVDSMVMWSLRVEPSEPGKGLEFVNKVVGGAIPKEYIAAIEKGVKERMENGIHCRLPVARYTGDRDRWFLSRSRLQ
jgi:translation elongation factor EF-G